ncbi:substrate-binding domain-containing protein [Ruficoccus amylovorans]|uniref:Substrate-binding domain-containing protein n=1 Tax=Ruficoccus amylovorans TaxID=1804625 RepID=A0A842HJW4_9BACT|nr:substrate-binding domain-containing protein [Ruficoccus amylovorans]MBC2595451.1 substrate-binding domain-containing protein [Ruficoccus amylovorans]
MPGLPTPPRIALLIRAHLSIKREILENIGQWVAHTRSWELEYLDDAIDARQWAVSESVSGIIAWPDSDENISFLSRCGRPVVTLGSLTGTLRPRIRFDNQAIGALAAEHFLQRGLRHFAFYGERMNYSYCTERLKGFSQRLKAEGFTPAVFSMQHDSQSLKNVLDQASGWLRDLPKPIGILADRDASGTHLLAMCQHAGIRVPDMVAVCGVGGDRILCRLGTPSLSSVQLPGKQIAECAIDLMSRMLNGDKVEPTTTLDEFRMIERASTNMFAEDDPVVHKALSHIRDHYHETATTDAIARACGVSRRVLERRFKNATARTVQNEVLRVRVMRAKDLLLDSEYSVAQIADLCGFTEPQRLSEAFRRHFGRSPSQIRTGKRPS